MIPAWSTCSARPPSWAKAAGARIAIISANVLISGRIICSRRGRVKSRNVLIAKADCNMRKPFQHWQDSALCLESPKSIEVCYEWNGGHILSMTKRKTTTKRLTKTRGHVGKPSAVLPVGYADLL